jgi:hypothetical protein
MRVAYGQGFAAWAPNPPPIECEGVAEVETMLTGIIQAYRHYLEKHVERTAPLANLLRISLGIRSAIVTRPAIASLPTLQWHVALRQAKPP